MGGLTQALGLPKADAPGGGPRPSPARDENPAPPRAFAEPAGAPVGAAPRPAAGPSPAVAASTPGRTEGQEVQAARKLEARLPGEGEARRPVALMKTADTTFGPPAHGGARPPVYKPTPDLLTPPPAIPIAPPTLPPLGADSAAALDRLALGMAKSTRPGPVVGDVAGAIHADGDQGRAEAHYLLRRLDEVAPEQARGLRQGLAESFADRPQLLHGAFPEHHAQQASQAEARNDPPLATDLPPDLGNEMLTGEQQVARAAEQGRGIIADLRGAQDRARPLDRQEIAAFDRRIEAAYPYLTDLQQRLKILVRAESAGTKGGGDDPAKAAGRRDALAQAEKDINDPDLRQAQRDIRDYYAAYSPERRAKLYAERGATRDGMERHVANALAISSQMDILRRKAATNAAWAAQGRPLAQANLRDAERSLAILDKALQSEADAIAGAGAGLAALPSHPHPELDKRGAKTQRATETAARRQRDLAAGAALTAASIGGGYLAKAGKEVAAAVLASAATTGQAAMSFTQGYAEKISGAARDAGVNMADAKAVARWAKANSGITAQAMRQPLGDVARGLASQGATKAFAEKLGLGPLGEAITERGIETLFQRGKE